VKTNFDRLLDRGQPFFDERAAGAMSFLTRWIASTSAPDARTFVIQLKEPFAGLPRLLTDRRMAILSASAIRQYKGDELGAHPVGTGPFVFVRHEHGQQLELKKNDKHWDGQPRLERIIFRQILDPTTLATAMQAGQIDLIPSAGPQMVEQLKTQRGLTVQYPEPANQYFLRLNTRAEPTRNPAFRRALNWAVNREAVATLLTGQVAPALGPVPRGNEISGPGVAEPYGYDLAKAKQLLAEAGVSSPVTLKLLVPTNGPGLASAPQVISLVQQQLKAIGVNLEPQFLEFAALLRTEGPGYLPEVHGSMNGWTTGADAAYWLERMFSGTQHPPRGVNRGWYGNKEVDALFERARGEVDDGKRGELYRQAAALIAADAPWVFLYQDRLPRVFRARVTGIGASASVYVDWPSIGLR
jgi:peptide/nickel transport system substrate-binding protein